MWQPSVGRWITPSNGDPTTPYQEQPISSRNASLLRMIIPRGALSTIPAERHIASCLLAVSRLTPTMLPSFVLGHRYGDNFAARLAEMLAEH